MRGVMALCLLGFLAACAAAVAPYAPEEVIRAKAYRAPDGPAITVITMVNNRSGGGGHSALMINGSQRVIFDPAGSFKHEIVPERNDVLFGITPAVLQGYRSAHARSTFHVVSQRIEVSPETAELALRLVQSYGAVGKALCTTATTGVLQQLPGFENIRTTFFPTKLMDQIEERPDVQTDRYFEDDEGGIVEGVAKVEL